MSTESQQSAQKPIRVADGDELADVLATHDRVLVDFYTKGCSLCQAIEPVLGNIAKATGITVAMVNPGNDISLVDEWNVRSAPTLVLVEDGEEVARLAEGFQGGDDIEAFLDEHLD
ncbi:thioredoxin family protein [Halobacterium sp. KA-6]|uniref:thioredoxin family protein n=1 Tax=Halobacterium sp. KA-6 TaxID=2896368 RepID=UPI001E633F13|nr:thioredoxin family protein [Halobacterium sp. KA-6]MCD2201912.1 thioredoxin family protein [Halobacterium sp. KA-6]